MEAYSMDLRVRIVQAYLAQEGSQAELAARFKVSERWLQNLLRQRRATGSIEPLPQGGGRARSIGLDQEPLLLEALAETPDASLDELRERCGVDGSRMGIARALRRLNITRKKSRSAARNNKIPRCTSNARLGKGRSKTASQRVLSSSTKPTPRPR
jgi:transposase